MPQVYTRSRTKRLLVILFISLLLLFGFVLLFVNRFVEPILRDRLHTLIIQGSDSLYTYHLGKLRSNFYGGNVEVENLQIQIDSSHYQKMAQENALPALTMQLNLVKGKIKGLGIFALVFGKRINIQEIYSKDADIKLLRHIRKKDEAITTEPLWKAIQPVIKSIAVGRINLDGVKLLYKNADTAASIKLQFDRCVARFDDIRVDSAASFDTSRIAFTKGIFMQFNDLKFRTPDSAYKLKAGVITYSSTSKIFEVVDFKIQPTREDRASFYGAVGKQESMQVISFNRARFTNLHLERFINNNIIFADTLYVEHPEMDIYLDRTQAPTFESNVGRYPHQVLLRAQSTIMVKGIVVENANITYTEKNPKSLKEGTLVLKDLDVRIANVTNDSSLIRQNSKCRASVSGKILGSSPIKANFTFYLDSTNGRFDASGTISNVSAAQLNALAVPLANIRLQSFDMHRLSFKVRADDYTAFSDVSMRYNNLFVILQKQDEETGANKTKKFLTKILNKFTLYDDNPGPNGVERHASDVRRMRLSTQSFFGFLWKSVFNGMQNVMMKSGRYE